MKSFWYISIIYCIFVADNQLNKIISMKTRILLFVLSCFALTVQAQTNSGGIDADMLKTIEASYKNTSTDKALGNAIRNVGLNSIAVACDNRLELDNYFSDEVENIGITDQKSSGRCWLFTGLNVMRNQMIRENNMGNFELSQVYPFFYDQLEKSNLFLQGIIDTRKQAMDDKMVEWLFKHPLSDGGQFTGIADIISKYGIVPSGVMKETASSNATRTMSHLLKLKLREDALSLRKQAAEGATLEELKNQKTMMLSSIYRILTLNLGTPPKQFTWTLHNKKGDAISTNSYTPQSFYTTFIRKDLKNDYVMLMNDPTRPYYKLYTIDFDRHAYDGENWTYVNLPIEVIKDFCIQSIKSDVMMYFSCDVGKYLLRQEGTLDVNNYNYSDLLGVSFTMDKKQRVQTFASGSSHAMTLMAVDIDNRGKTTKWKVENSWGDGPNDGHLIISDQWFEEYMFRVVVEKRFVNHKVLRILKQEPIKLPAWDPMFQDEK